MADQRLNLPMVPLRGLTIMPGMIVHFDVSRESSIQAVPTGQTQFKAILSTSHSGTHSCTARGHRTVHSQMFCPVTAHSPTAEVCMQQVIPNQLHIRALLSEIILSHSSTNRHLYLLCTGKQNLCFLFPTRFVDLLFALYPLLPSLSIG